MLHVAPIAALVAEVNATFGGGWRDFVNALAIAAVTAIYYALARWIGRRLPAVEKYLLGSSATPIYVARHSL